MSSLQDLAENVLPAVNASLNGLSAACVLAGFAAVRQKNVRVHRAFMLMAVCASALFLVSYLTRAALTGTHRFEGPAGWRLAYLVILFSHMILAVAVVPLVARTVWLGLKDRREQHRRLARITLPIWLYVSVTGVVIYFLLYHVSGTFDLQALR